MALLERAGRACASRKSGSRALAAAAAVILLAAGCGDASATTPAARPVEDSWLGTLFGAGRSVEEKAKAVEERPSVVNASVLLQMIAKRRANGSRVVVNFFSSSCPFSAEFEPVYEALPQVFGEAVSFVALDAQRDRQLNMRFHIGAFPTVICFNRGRPVARYNGGPSTTQQDLLLKRVTRWVEQATNSTPVKALSSIKLRPAPTTGRGAESGVGRAGGAANAGLIWVLILCILCLAHIVWDGWWRSGAHPRREKDKEE